MPVPDSRMPNRARRAGGTSGEDGMWFAPKVFGIGATPVTWQGWALTAGSIAVMLLAGLALLPRHRTLCIVFVVIVMLGFTAIAAQRTRGGWRWRWGGDR